MVKPKYYLVERTLLPEVFQRVIEANEAIASGKAATASEAAKLAGLSRSAYYKYKDGVRPFFEATTDRIVTFHFMLHDQPGMLSSILGLMAKSGANLMTVNQSIPMRGQASVTIAARTGEIFGRGAAAPRRAARGREQGRDPCFRMINCNKFSHGKELSQW